ncbi:MAG: hypothetical protein ACRC10_10425 [Thermoguttaceae bacterium]
MSTLNIPRRFFFQFAFECPYLPKLWTPNDKNGLENAYQIPAFAQIEQTESVSTPQSQVSPFPLDCRIGWNEKGLSFSFIVRGKKRAPWCRLTHPEESDSVQICLDTRDVRNVHRATRFCHRFAFLPIGQGNGGKEPAVFWFPIHRAKGHPNPIVPESIPIRSTLFEDGYRMDLTLGENVLTGYEPLEHSRLGFHYYLVDQELGHYGFLADLPFPHDNDPSLWGIMECVKNSKTG